VSLLGRHSQHPQHHLGHALRGLLEVDVGLGEPQLQQGQQAPAQRGQRDDRLGHGEPAGGDAQFQVLQRTLGQAAVGVDVREPAMAQDPHDLRV
jgi:hypothetical protein